MYARDSEVVLRSVGLRVVITHFNQDSPPFLQFVQGFASIVNAQPPTLAFTSGRTPSFQKKRFYQD